MNEGIKKRERLHVSLLLSSSCARLRRKSPFGADGHDPVGTHHADRKQIPALSLTTFVTFGIPSQ